MSANKDSRNKLQEEFVSEVVRASCRLPEGRIETSRDRPLRFASGTSAA